MLSPVFRCAPWRREGAASPGGQRLPREGRGRTSTATSLSKKSGLVIFVTGWFVLVKKNEKEEKKKDIKKIEKEGKKKYPSIEKAFEFGGNKPRGRSCPVRNEG